MIIVNNRLQHRENNLPLPISLETNMYWNTQKLRTTRLNFRKFLLTIPEESRQNNKDKKGNLKSLTLTTLNTERASRKVDQLHYSQHYNKQQYTNYQEDPQERKKLVDSYGSNYKYYSPKCCQNYTVIFFLFRKKLQRG